MTFWPYELSGFNNINNNTLRGRLMICQPADRALLTQEGIAPVLK